MTSEHRAMFQDLALDLTDEEQAIMDRFWAENHPPDIQAAMVKFWDAINHSQILNRQIKEKCDRMQQKIDRLQKKNDLSVKKINDGVNQALAKIGPDGRRRARRARLCPTVPRST